MNVRVIRSMFVFTVALIAVSAFQSASARPIIIIKDPALYVYPGSFPCVNGPGFCERWIIIALAAKDAKPDFDYSQTGNIQMAASVQQRQAFLADVNLGPIPASLEPFDNAVVIPTIDLDGGLN